MAECLLLLCDTELAGPLSEALRRHNPGLLIVCAHTRDDLDNAVATAGPFDRLIGFCTETIVPAPVLAGLSGPAYNFHPASPDYPGSHPASFALYDGVTRFAATAHEMAPKVDSGPIIDIEWFDVPPTCGVLALEDRAGEAAAHLFWRLAPLLAHCGQPLPRSDRAWGPRKTTRQDFRAMGMLDPAISAAEFERRWRAFGARDPSIMQLVLHGRHFALADGQPAAAPRTAGPGPTCRRAP
ncbi:MAG: methionyl-tRNA formyltransferase [Proteobacteria bacterium]|nr:methionyl-tRNA formyltransferase [Pseudomonadota bacterium]